MKLQSLILLLSVSLPTFAWEQFKELDGATTTGASISGIETEAALPSGGTCPDSRSDWMRVTKESEKLTKYYKTQSAETKIDVGGQATVEIYAVGCDGVDQTFTGEADIKGESAFPDNIVIPVKADSAIVNVTSIKTEADLNAGMMKFITSAKKKIKEGYVIDGSKEIVVYATATAVAPSCGAEKGYDKQIVKSFDDTKMISNSELAYKRALNAAKLIKKLLVDPTISDSGSKTKIKIKAYCSINVGTVPALKVFGMLKKGEHVEKLTKVYKCGDDIAINGGVGNKAAPAWVEDKIYEYSMIGKGTPTLTIQIPSVDKPVSWVEEIKKYGWSSCLDTIYKKDTNTWTGKTYTFADKTKTAKTSEECRKHSCQAYFTATKVADWKIPEMIYCNYVDALHPYPQTRTKPGDFQVTADDSKDYTIAWDPMTFTKGQRLRLNFDAVYVPDRFVVTVNGSRVIDSGYVSCVIDDTNQYHTGLPNLTPPQPKAERGNYYSTTTPNASCPSLPTGVTGTQNGIDYVFPKDTANAKIKLHVFGPYGTTIWRAKISCPDSGTTESTLVTDTKTKFGIK